MKKNLLGVAIALAFMFAPLAVRAQQNVVANSIRQAVSRDGKHLTAGAEIMPAGKYNYAPTPQQMTFGHLVLHVAQSNNLLCSGIAGEHAPSTGHLTEHSPKAQLITALKASFSYCDQVLAKVNDGDLSAQVPFFGGRQVPRAVAMIALSNDLADHYAQQAIYLRLNGHLPPTGEGPVMTRSMKRGKSGGM